MKLNEFVSDKEREQLDEILPALLGAARGVAAVGGAALRGGAAVAKGVGNVAVKGAQAVGGAVKQGAQAVGSAVKQGVQAVGQAAGAAGEEDPAAQAQQVMAQKKEVQDQIKAMLLVIAFMY